MWPFKQKQYEELTLQIKGWEKVKVPVESQCHHECVLACEDSLTDFAYCERCGLRTPSVPHGNYAWAGKIFREAKLKGKLFRDPSNLHKIYVLDKERGSIEPTLTCLYGGSRKKEKGRGGK